MDHKFAIGESVSYRLAGLTSGPFQVMWRVAAETTLYGIKSKDEENERTVPEAELVALFKMESMSETVKRMCRYPHTVS